MASRDEERRIAHMNLKKMIYSMWHNDAAISLNLCRTDPSVSLQIRLLECCLEDYSMKSVTGTKLVSAAKTGRSAILPSISRQGLVLNEFIHV